MNNSIIALVPMKAHSERVPDKNIREFAGEPLYFRALTALSQSKYVKRIVVNTDSDVIAEQAPMHFPKVRIIKRPVELQGDFVSMNKIIAHDISQIDGDYFLQTHSSNPLITTETIDKAIETYFDNLSEYDSLFSVTRFQSRFYDEQGKAVNHDPGQLIRTQDLPPLFEENSNLYIFSKESFENAGNKRIGAEPMLFEMDKLEALDIDEPGDFELAELIYKSRANKTKF